MLGCIGIIIEVFFCADKVFIMLAATADGDCDVETVLSTPAPTAI